MDQNATPGQNPENPYGSPQPTGGAGYGAPGRDGSDPWGHPGQAPGQAPSSPYGSQGSPQGQDPYGQHAYPSPYSAPARRPGIIPLIPLALGDLLSGSFAVIRRSPAAVVGTALIMAAVQAVFALVLTNLLFDAVQQLMDLEASGATDPDAYLSMLAQMSGLLGLALLGMLLASLVGLLASGVMGVVIVRAAAGLSTGLGQAWRLSARALWSLTGLALLYLLAGILSGALFIGVFAGIIASAVSEDFGTTAVLAFTLFGVSVLMTVLWIWLGVRLSLAATASAVELKGPFRALGRSWSLMRGHWWRTFGVMLLVIIIVGVISSVITTPLSMLSGAFIPLDPTEANTAEYVESNRIWTLVGGVVSALVNSLATVYTSCLIALIYVDYRIRHESFDLDLAAAAQAAGSAEDARFSTVRDVQSASGTEDLVPGRQLPGH